MDEKGVLAPADQERRRVTRISERQRAPAAVDDRNDRGDERFVAPLRDDFITRGQHRRGYAVVADRLQQRGAHAFHLFRHGLSVPGDVTQHQSHCFLGKFQHLAPIAAGLGPPGRGEILRRPRKQRAPLTGGALIDHATRSGSVKQPVRMAPRSPCASSKTFEAFESRQFAPARWQSRPHARRVFPV